MRAAIVTDCHFGARQGNQTIHAHFMKFYEEVFFPYLEDNNIDTVIMGGDTVEHRKYISFVILNILRTRYFDVLHDMGITVHCIIGNHDLPYKSSSDIDAITELFSSYDNLNIITEPTAIELDGLAIDLVPWIHSGNYDDSISFIQNSKSPLCIGHLEINGFEMYRGSVAEGGMSKSVFGNYDHVFSGHFHHRSTKGNITYLGTPYQITWSDFGDERGFHVLDTDTRDVEFIQNPYKLFHKIDYPLEQHSVLDASKLANTYVKIMVKDRSNPVALENFVQGIINVGPIDVSVVDVAEIGHESIDVDHDLNVDDTRTLISKYVKQLHLPNSNIKRIEKELLTIHKEALELNDRLS